MQIDRRLTNGLAWAGVVLVIGVPLADFVSARMLDEPATVAVVTDAVTPVPASERPAAPAPAATKTAEAEVKPAPEPVTKPSAPGDAVGNYLASGRKLPSYISGGDAAKETAATPTPTVAPRAPVTTQEPAETAAAPVPPPAPAPVVEEQPTTVAALQPQKIAPVPMPLSMRPRPVAQPLATAPVPEAIVIPEQEFADYNAPVTADDLADWESGPLSEFLAARQGRDNPRTERRSQVTYERNGGFFLDQAPLDTRRGDRYVGPIEEEYFLPFF